MARFLLGLGIPTSVQILIALLGWVIAIWSAKRSIQLIESGLTDRFVTVWDKPMWFCVLLGWCLPFVATGPIWPPLCAFICLIVTIIWFCYAYIFRAITDHYGLA